MTRIIAVSDLHYHNYKQFSTVKDGVNSRLLDVDKTFEAAISVGKVQKADVMAVSGDMFNERGRIRPSIFNMVYNRVKAAAKVFPVVIIPGNHDMEDQALGASAVDTLEEIENCFVLKGNDGFKFETVEGLKFLGIQYFHSTKGFKATFEKGLSKCPQADVVIMHQGIDDFNFTAGMPATKITCEYLCSQTDAWVLCGHYHSPRAAGKIINVGAALQHNMADEGSERGCWLINTEKCEATFHALHVAPKFVTVAAKKDISGVTGVKGNFVKIKAKTLRTAKTLERAIEDAGALQRLTSIEKEYTAAHEKTIPISGSPTQMLADYCKLVPDLAPHEAEIVALYEKVCR